MAKRPKPVHQLTSAQFDSMFPIGDEGACRAYLKARRWPDGVRCPRCDNAKVYALASGYHWQCEACAVDGYRFSVIAGTIFENTNKPLRDWFKVVHLMLTSKKGMSSRQIGRYMGFGSVKTAWLMGHKIRTALIEPETKLGGIVEMDETYIGGKDSNRHWNKRSNGRGGAGSGKTTVIGAVSRKGNVVARMIDRVDNLTVDRFVHRAIDERVSTLVTDEAPYFKHMRSYYPHEVICHAAKQYVVGAIHTNTIEGFWSILKRGIMGSYHKISRKYLPLYVAEFQFRYNNRFNPDIFGTAIEGC